MIRLRDVSERDRDRLFEWRNLPDVRRWMYTDHVIQRSEHDAWFDAMLIDPTRKYWVILLGDDPVGVVNLSEINPIERRTSWAFYIGDDRARGKGVGAATEYLVLEYVFMDMEFDRIWCEVLIDNGEVVRLHKKFGFVEEGVLRKHVAKNGERSDVVVLGLLRPEWEQRRCESQARLRSRGAIR